VAPTASAVETPSASVETTATASVEAATRVKATTVVEAATKYSLPLPKYAFDGIYLNLTIYRHPQAAVQALASDVLEKLSKSERSGWQWLSTKGHANSSDYAAQMGLDDRTVRRHLNQFLRLGLVRKAGAGRSTEYRIK